MTIDPARLIQTIQQVEEHKQKGDLNNYELNGDQLVQKGVLTRATSSLFELIKPKPQEKQTIPSPDEYYETIKSKIQQLKPNLDGLTENPPKGIEHFWKYFPDQLTAYLQKYHSDTGINLFNNQWKTDEQIKELNRVREKLKSTKIIWTLLEKIDHPITKSKDIKTLYDQIFIQKPILDPKASPNLFTQIDKLNETLRYQIADHVLEERVTSPTITSAPTSTPLTSRLKNLLTLKLSAEEQRERQVEQQKQKLTRELSTSRVKPEDRHVLSPFLNATDPNAQRPVIKVSKSAEEMRRRQEEVKAYIKEETTTDTHLIHKFIDNHLEDLFPLFEHTDVAIKSRNNTLEENQERQLKSFIQNINKLRAGKNTDWEVKIDSTEEEISKKQKVFIPELFETLETIPHNLSISSDYSLSDEIKQAGNRHLNDEVIKFKKELLSWLAKNNNSIEFDEEYNQITVLFSSQAQLLGCNETTSSAYIESINGLISSLLFEKNKTINDQYILRCTRTEEIHKFSPTELNQLFERFFPEGAQVTKAPSASVKLEQAQYPMTQAMERNKESYQAFNRKLRLLRNNYVLGDALNTYLDRLKEDMKQATQFKSGRFFTTLEEKNTSKISEINSNLDTISHFLNSSNYFNLLTKVEASHRKNTQKYGSDIPKEFDQDIAYINRTYSFALFKAFPKENTYFDTVKHSYLAHAKLIRLDEKSIAEVEKVMKELTPFTKQFVVEHYKLTFQFINDLNKMIEAALAIKNKIDTTITKLTFDTFLNNEEGAITDIEAFKANLAKYKIPLDVTPQNFKDFMNLLKILLNTPDVKLTELKSDLTAPFLSKKIGISQSTALRNFLRPLSDEEAKSFFITNKIDGRELPQVQDLVQELPVSKATDFQSKNTRLALNIQAQNIQKEVNDVNKNTIEQRDTLKNVLEELKTPPPKKTPTDINNEAKRFINIIVGLNTPFEELRALSSSSKVTTLLQRNPVKQFLDDNCIPYPNNMKFTLPEVKTLIWNHFHFDPEGEFFIDLNDFKDKKAAASVLEEYFPETTKVMIEKELTEITAITQIKYQMIDNFEKLDLLKQELIKNFNEECSLDIKNFDDYKKLYPFKERIKLIMTRIKQLEIKDLAFKEILEEKDFSTHINQYNEMLIDKQIIRAEKRLNELNINIREALRIFLSQGYKIPEDKKLFKDRISNDIEELNRLIESLYELIKSKIPFFKTEEDTISSIDAFINKDTDVDNYNQQVLKPVFTNIIKNYCSSLYNNEDEMNPLMYRFSEAIDRAFKQNLEPEALISYLIHQLESELSQAPKAKETTNDYIAYFKSNINSTLFHQYINDNKDNLLSYLRVAFGDRIKEHYSHLFNNTDKTEATFNQLLESLVNTDPITYDGVISSISTYLATPSEDDKKIFHDPTLKDLSHFMEDLQKILSQGMQQLDPKRWEVLKEAKTLQKDIS